MFVYVIKKTGLISLSLPSKISGSYWIKDYKDSGKVRELVNIREQDGKWVVNSNKKISIVIGGKKVESVVLQNYLYFILTFNNNSNDNENVEVFVSPSVDNTIVKLKYKDFEQLSFGSDKGNNIMCVNQLVDGTHFKIYNKDKAWFVEDCNTKHGTFINNNYVNGTRRLFFGDTIFVMGIKVIFLNGYLFVNNPLDSVFYDKNLFVEVVPSNTIGSIEFSESDDVINLYNESDYFVRSPRFTEVVEEKDFLIEDPPNIGEEDKTPLLLTMGPMVTMGMTSVVYVMSSVSSLQNGASLMSTAPMLVMSVSMILGTFLWPVLTRKYEKKQRKEKVKLRNLKYGEYLIAKEKELKYILETQKQIMLSNYLNSQECYQYIVYLNKYLWTRELNRDNFLSIRLGLGDVDPKINISCSEKRFSLETDDLLDKMHKIVDDNKKILNAPIVVSLTERNIMAIAGKYEIIKPYMDTILIQLFALHGYYDLKIVLFTNEDNLSSWEYLDLIPHIWSDDKEMRFFSSNSEEGLEISQYLNFIYESRLSDYKDEKDNKEAYKNFSSYYLIITDDLKNTRDYSIIKNMLEHEGVNLGFGLVVLHPNLTNLPTECNSFIVLDNAQEGVVLQSELSSDTRIKFKVEHVSNIDFQLYPMKLANVPIENENESYNFPKILGFLEMYDVGLVEQLNPLERWKESNPVVSLGVPVGVDESGNLFKIDLHEKAHGPHGLIAGMTGSGKSEFIITYILSMALNFHPDEVQFVLIDYKGGGLVGAFENKEIGLKLPHLAGTITNLDIADINRALASIESELKRRQRLFNEARDKLGEGTIDIYKYQRYYRDGAIDEPVSHLFIISDEFAELKDQQPDFMDQLISTARIGRSLGVHLILATQKPSGVVDDQIWSNSRFRVCLKVQDASDSNEMLKRDDAALIKDTGRFYLQVGYDEFFALGQAAWAGSKYVPQEKVYHEVDDSISFVDHIGRSYKTMEPPKKVNDNNYGEELPNIVKYLNKVALMEGIDVKKLWLEKIPGVIFVDNLKRKYNYKKVLYHLNPVIGEYDDPKAQSQGLLTIDFEAAGNTIVYSVNDKSIMINSIVYSLITTYTTDEVNIYMLDLDSETLKIYQNAPQVGDVVFANEEEKIKNLFNVLNSELLRRRKLFQNYNGNYRFYCDNSGNKLPAIVFILTGFENFSESFEDYEDIFTAISRDCVRYGIYLVVTAVNERAMRIGTRSNFQNILPLKIPGGKVEYDMLLGKKCPEISDIDGRGVALINDNAFEFQTSSVCDSSNFNAYISKVIDSLNSKLTTKAPRVPVLPDVVSLNDVLYKLNGLASVPVGINVDTLEVATFNFIKNFMFMINSNDGKMLKNFIYLLTSEISNIPNINAVFIDLDSNYSDVVFDKNITYLNLESLANLDNIIKSGNVSIIFVTGFVSFAKKIEEISKVKLDSYFDSIYKLGNCHFVLVDKFLDLKDFIYNTWFKKYVSNDNGIWIGKGLGDINFFNLQTSFRVLNIPIESNYGYNIIDGNAISIKILESDSDEDE